MNSSSTPYTPPARNAWRVNLARASAWRSWDGEMVVYDDCSGDTVKLDVVMAEIFHRLSAAPATLEELTAHLAEVLDLEGERRLGSVTDTGVRRLAASGLIEREDATLVTSIPG